jgi:hypothetical protein
MNEQNKEPWSTRIGRIVGDFDRAARNYNVSRLVMLKHLFNLWRKNGLRPHEAHSYGISNPQLPDVHYAAAISKQRMKAIQKQVNTSDLTGIMDDKAVFYPLCQGFKLPVPELYAVYDRPLGWTAAGEKVASPSEWLKVLDGLAGDIFVKPARGSYGMGIRALSRVPEGFRDDATDKIESLTKLLDWLVANPFQRFVIQKRLKNHKSIIGLTGSDTLQTVRVVTFLNESGECLLAGCFMKLVTRQGVVTDNLYLSRTGNVICAVDLATGSLRPAIKIALNGNVPEILDRHPRTGVRIDGFVLPNWQDVLHLVRRAALLFSPIRAIGWDVAFTPEGAVLVEGNAWADPAINFALSAACNLQQAYEMERMLGEMRARPTGPAYQRD